jgi:hypothetical protein
MTLPQRFDLLDEHLLSTQETFQRFWKDRFAKYEGASACYYGAKHQNRCIFPVITTPQSQDSKHCDSRNESY